MPLAETHRSGHGDMSGALARIFGVDPGCPRGDGAAFALRMAPPVDDGEELLRTVSSMDAGQRRRLAELLRPEESLLARPTRDEIARYAGG